MNADATTGSILDALVPIIALLMFGVLAVIASRLLRLSPIVGYIGLGITLSATGLDRVMGTGSIETLAELGVVFLLFDIGLHFSFAHVGAQAKDIFAFGPAQVVLGAIGLGALALLWGLPIGAALLVGATLALSSTAVVAGVIAERHQQNCPVGLTGTAILIFQDLAAILILIVANAMGSGEAVLPAVGLALVKAGGAFAMALLLARFTVRPLFGLVARTRNEEVFTAIALLVALSTAWASGRIGLSLTLGAFLGGMILADTPYTAVIKAEIKPFRGLLLGFFFISVGLSLDRTVLVEHWIAIITVALLLFGVKIMLNASASLIFRWSIPGSTQLGFLLAQGSEFAFVILSMSSVRALVGQRECSVLVAAVALTLAATPAVADAGRQLAGRLRRRTSAAINPELLPRELPGPVLIVGMGRRGRAVADAMTEFGIGYAAVERDERRLREAVADGYQVMFGDAGDSRLWSAVTMEGRRISVLTAPLLEASTQVSRFARTLYPDLHRFAAVADTQTAAEFAAIGVTPVIDGDPAPGVAIAVAVLEALGADDDRINDWIATRRARTLSEMPTALALT